jgi:hypothetical protein
MTPTLAISRNQPTAGPQDDVALAAQGDRRAFERVYRVHVDRVFSVCVRMVGDRGRAEELPADQRRRRQYDLRRLDEKRTPVVQQHACPIPEVALDQVQIAVPVQVG